MSEVTLEIIHTYICNSLCLYLRDLHISAQLSTSVCQHPSFAGKLSLVQLCSALVREKHCLRTHFDNDWHTIGSRVGLVL